MIADQELRYLVLFNNRRDSETARDTWLSASNDILDNYISDAVGNTREAAQALIADGWSLGGCNTLAYSAFCFWHRLLPQEATAADENKPITIGDIYGTGRTIDAAVKRIFTQPESAERKAIITETNHRIGLATVAFNAITLQRTAYEDFHENFFGKVLGWLAEDAIVQDYIKKWPHILKEDGTYFPDAVQVPDGWKNAVLFPHIAKQIQDLNPAILIDRISPIMRSCAKEINPSAFFLPASCEDLFF